MERSSKIIREVAVHVLVWASIYGVMLFQMYTRFGNVGMVYDFLPRLVMNISLFYLNYYILVPKLLLKKQILIYILVSAGLILLGSFLMELVFPPHFQGRMPMPPDQEFPGFRDRPSGPKPSNLRDLLTPSVIVAFHFVVGAMLRMYTEWNKNEMLREKVENEKINSELQFLKTQLNPHFLFNSLNAVYTLSVKKSADTSEAILNLSELMRYMIYEANRDVVPLSNELDYLKSYIHLQRLRISNTENVFFNIYGNAGDKVIKPLLFISFIENAFKYGTDYKGRSDVVIKITIREDTVELFVKNKIGITRKVTPDSGIGLKNIESRLQLLYPDSHDLKIEDDGEFYTVNLTIKLS